MITRLVLLVIVVEQISTLIVAVQAPFPLIGTQLFPWGAAFGGERLMEVSGCVTRPDNKVVLASDVGYIYVANVSYGSGLTVAPVTSSAIKLQVPPGQSRLDSEGVRVSLLTGTDLLVSTEARQKGLEREGDSVLLRFRTTGEFVKKYSLPDAWRHKPGSNKGSRINMGMEAIAGSSDGKKIFVASEGPLYQDGDVPTGGNTTYEAPVRLLEYAVSNDGKISYSKSYRYNLNVAPPSQKHGKHADIGLASLLFVDDMRMLALERTWDHSKNRIEIYEIDFSQAEPITACDSLQTGVCASKKPVKKKLLFDLEKEYNVKVDNYESMCWGPNMSDGTRVLLLINDNNDNKFQIGTQFIALSVPNSWPEAAQVGSNAILAEAELALKTKSLEHHHGKRLRFRSGLVQQHRQSKFKFI